MAKRIRLYGVDEGDTAPELQSVTVRRHTAVGVDLDERIGAARYKSRIPIDWIGSRLFTSPAEAWAGYIAVKLREANDAADALALAEVCRERDLWRRNRKR